jgi:hypothetical protein
VVADVVPAAVDRRLARQAAAPAPVGRPGRWPADAPTGGRRALGTTRRAGRVIRAAAATISSPVAAILAGFGLFLLLAPLVAVARQAAMLGVAWLLGVTTELVETQLLPLLPVDPVYGGAGLRVLGGIEPRGLALAGPVGDALHRLLPTIFGAAELTAADAAVSALVDPGVTVLARLLTALAATAVLVASVGLAVERLRRGPLELAAQLAQIWLLVDLAHESALSVRELEATGLPFALAAFAPADAQGQRALLTTGLEAIPDPTIGAASAALVVAVCLLGAILLRAVLRAGLHLATGRSGCWRRAHSGATHARGLLARPGRLAPGRSGADGPLSARLTSILARLMPPALPGLAALTVLAVLLSASPLGRLAEGELAVLISPSGSAGDAAVAPPEVGPVVEEPAAGADDVDAERSAGTAAMLAAPPAQPSTSDDAASRGSVVVLDGREYRYTLRVDGRPTVVRGMGYNPWYAGLPTDERRAFYRRDFGAMRAIGVNTIEGWFERQFDEVTLDEAQRQGLKVILPFELNQDYDYGDPAVRARFREQVTAWVLRYRDHPALLMWGPGNEVMHRLIFPTAVQGLRDPAREQRADDFAAFYVELIDLIHQLDPNHPVVYRDAEDLYLGRLRDALLRDGVRRPWFAYGTNVYTPRLADVIDRWPTQGLDAPLLVSEVSPGGAGPVDRPRMLGWYWSTIRAHPERVLGGVVYTWTTRGPEDLDRVFGLTDESGAPVDGSIEALRQLFHADTVGRRGPSRQAETR